MPPTQEKVVYAVSTCGSETADGMTINLTRGDCWAADDPFVLSHPGLFSDTPVPRRSTAAAPVVEQATAAPGERRTTRRV